jgi:hypothetical protein
MLLLKPLLHAVAGLGGMVLVVLTLSAAIRSFVLPRNEAVRLNVWVFRSIRSVFEAAARLAPTYGKRDTIMAHYAPVALVALPVVWLAIISAGYTVLFWSLGAGTWAECYRLSNSSLLTLGSEKSSSLLVSVFTYSEATLGLLLMTLLISYLPTIYQAFSRRETTVARLELRAGAPASACALLSWLNHSGSLQDDGAQWEQWEQWFIEIEESHTSLPILTFFRSPQPGRSWVTAGGLILDTANLLFSALDVPQPRQAELAFKAGCLALNRVYRFFDDEAGTQPAANLPENDPIEDPGRADFDHACADLAAMGLPLRPDRDAAWAHYRELRTRYVTALDFLARLTMAPPLKSV